MEKETIQASKFKKKKMKILNNPIENIIGHGVTILAGKPRIGKTNILLQIATALSTKGCKFLGQNCLFSKVLYFSNETNESEIQKRLNKLDYKAENLYINTSPEPYLRDIREEIYKYNLRRKKKEEMLIIIDTFQNVMYDKNFDNNNYKDMYYLMKEYKSISEEFDCNFILAHHVNKSNNSNDIFDSLNGSVGLRGAVENLLILSQDNNSFQLNIDSRYFTANPIPLIRNSDGFFELSNKQKIINTNDRDLIELIKFINRLEDKRIEDTATNICTKANLKYTIPRILYKKLDENKIMLLQNYINFSKRRSNGKTLIKIEIDENEEEDDDANEY